MIDTRDADSSCPNCGAPLELHIPGAYSQEDWCDYAAGLRSTYRNLEQSHKRWRERAERAERERDELQQTIDVSGINGQKAMREALEEWKENDG